jgi:hypothetical protein
MDEIRFTSELWRWESRRDDWYFVSLPVEFTEPISEVPREPRGFNLVKVRATVGDTSWTTSIVPMDSGSYCLPMKRSVRDAEGIAPGDHVEVVFELI